MSILRDGNVHINHKSANSYPYRFMSLPRRIGRIISAFFDDLATNSAFFSPLIINASLYPVRIPR